MLTTTRSEIFDENGKKIDWVESTTEFKVPVFLNLQICLEKEQYIKLKEICEEYKSSITKAVQDLLEDDPEKLVEQYF